MEQLIETIKDQDQEITFWYCEHVAIRSVLAVIFQTLSNMHTQNIQQPSLEWKKLNDAQIIWAADKDKNTIGGICFVNEKEFNMINILLIFEDPAYSYSSNMHKKCIDHMISYGKQKDISGLYHILHIEDLSSLNRSKLVGMHPTHYILTRSLINEDAA
jgi:hypothetical protein